MKNPKLHHLAEMPRRIPLPPNEFGLKSEDYNTKIAAAVLKSNSTVVLENLSNNRLLCRYKNKFMLIDSTNIKVLYYMHFKIKYFNFLKRNITCEVLHWKNRAQLLFGLSNLSSHVFFKYLLPINGIIMTDYLHTEFGEYFWVRRIGEAFDFNLNVYYLNLLPVSKTVNQELIQLKDVYDLMQLTNPDNNIDRSPWGDERKHEGRRILISQFPIS